MLGTFMLAGRFWVVEDTSFTKERRQGTSGIYHVWFWFVDRLQTDDLNGSTEDSTRVNAHEFGS